MGSPVFPSTTYHSDLALSTFLRSATFHLSPPATHHPHLKAMTNTTPHPLPVVRIDRMVMDRTMRVTMPTSSLSCCRQAGSLLFQTTSTICPYLQIIQNPIHLPLPPPSKTFVNAPGSRQRLLNSPTPMQANQCAQVTQPTMPMLRCLETTPIQTHIAHSPRNLIGMWQSGRSCKVQVPPHLWNC